MASQPIEYQCLQYSKSQAELELLNALLQLDVSYPWNPADPGSEAFLANLDKEWRFDEIGAEDLRARSQSLLNKLDQIWSPCPQPAPQMAGLVEALHRRFNEAKTGSTLRIPQAWLEAIASRASELLSTNLSLAEQLVECVRQQLPDWREDDLQVLARPFAYAMRGESLESTLATLSQKDWTALSEIEKARLSLAIARYALSELHS